MCNNSNKSQRAIGLLVKMEGATSISIILLVNVKVENFPPYKNVPTIWAKHTKTTVEEPLVWEISRVVN
jgi:hypothetical protein